jgi:CRISPR-associated protein Cmr1
MNEPLTITLKTLTPLWTGGADGTSDRLHVTGLMGSLRWWYEALVRGLGGYVSDPTAENPEARSEFNAKAYEEARHVGKSDAEALREGLKTVCPVSYLFGATGWARLFQLQARDVPITPLHFRTTVRMNQSWLRRVFGGETQDISRLTVPYGTVQCQLAQRGYDADYARDQLALVLRFAADYGGLGAKLQHGFGQIALALPPEMQNVTIAGGLAQLAGRLRSGGLLGSGPATDTPFDLRNFVSLTYDVPARSLAAFTADRAHFGSDQKRAENNYLPCAFDLRYKGDGNWGMRRWLENPYGPKRWSHADANELMGVSKKRGEVDVEDDRQASRLCFGMPYRLDSGDYRLRVFGFAPAQLLTPEELRDLCNEYIGHALNVQPARVTLGRDLVAQVQGGLR